MSLSQLENGAGGRVVPTMGNSWNAQASELLRFPWQQNKSKTKLSVPTIKYVFIKINLKYFSSLKYSMHFCS
jgi:hypothetical protein